LVAQSGLVARLPPGVGARGDLGYPGPDQRHPLGALPRRTPRGPARPPEDVADNRAFARRRIAVAHTSGQVRSSQSLAQTARQHRCHHAARTRAVAGLVNRRLRRVRTYRERLAA